MAEEGVAAVNCLKADCPHHPTQSRDDVPLSQFLLDVSFIPCQTPEVGGVVPGIECVYSEEILLKVITVTKEKHTATKRNYTITLGTNSQLCAVT